MRFFSQKEARGDNQRNTVDGFLLQSYNNEVKRGYYIDMTGELFNKTKLFIAVFNSLILALPSMLSRNFNSPKQTVGFLEFQGTIPEDVATDGMGYSLELNGESVMFPQGWDKGYIPSFVPVGKAGKFYKILCTIPLQIKKGQNTLLIKYLSENKLQRPMIRERIEANIEKEVDAGGANFIFYPNESPKVTFSLTSDREVKCKAELVFYAVSLADNRGEDDWRPGLRVVPTQVLERKELKLNLRKNESKRFEFPFPTNHFGTISVFLILREGEKILPIHILNYAIVHNRKEVFNENGILIASCGEARYISALKKMGIDWVRYEVGWDGFEPEKGKFSWGRYDEFIEECRRRGMFVIVLTEGAPEWAKPKGDFLDVPYKDFKIKLDWSPGREHYEDWKEAWKEFLKRYKDVVKALNVWNEPWEGGGISGWKSTGEHYRELLKRVEEARDEVDPSIKIVAADSSHNTDWKLFSKGMDKDIDVISIHYEFPVQSSYSFAMARYYKKEVWDTESWLNWMGDACCLRGLLHEIALGAKKVSPFVTNLLFDENNFPNTSVGWASALARFLQGKEFHGLAHPQRPPFVFLFKGDKENVAVATTTLWTHYQYRHNYPWGQFSDSEKVTMILPSQAMLKVYDMYGNPIPLKKGRGGIEIPLGSAPKYIVSEKSFAEFNNWLSKAIYIKLPPVEIKIHQINEPIEKKPYLRIDLRNVHPLPLSGELELKVSGLELEEKSLSIKLSPLEEHSFYIRIKGRKGEGGNSFPCQVIVKTNIGTSIWKEDLVVAVIRKGHIEVDGDLSDWRRIEAVPIPLSGISAVSETLKAWFPWEEFSKKAGDFAGEVAFAYDKENLYFMARVKDKTRNLLPSLLSGRNLHKFQKPPGDYVYYEAGPFPGASGDMLKLSLSPLQEEFNEKYDVFPPNSPLRHLGHYISAGYQYLVYPIQEGGGEILRVRTPDFYYLHPLPINYSFLRENCRVEGSKLVIKLLDDGYIYEGSIPFSELKNIKPQDGKRIRLSFIIQNGDMANILEFSRGKSLCHINTLDFEPGWGAKYTAETEFEFVE